MKGHVFCDRFFSVSMCGLFHKFHIGKLSPSITMYKTIKHATHYISSGPIDTFEAPDPYLLNINTKASINKRGRINYQKKEPLFHFVLPDYRSAISDLDSGRLCIFQLPRTWTKLVGGTSRIRNILINVPWVRCFQKVIVQSYQQ